jgi:hypothetical protein
MMVVRGAAAVFTWRRASAPSAPDSYLRPEASVSASLASALSP